MHRYPHRLLTSLALAGAAAVFFFHVWRPAAPSQSPFCIGLVYTPSRIFHEQVAARLKELIAGDARFSVKEFVSGGTDLLSIKICCKEAAASNADLLITTAIYCSQETVQATRKGAPHKPVVFLGVNDPVALGLVETMEKPGANVTGIESNAFAQDAFTPADLLPLVKPGVKKILLPYGVSVGQNEALAQRIQKTHQDKGIAVTLLPIDTITDTLALVSSHLPGHDTLLYLEADGVGSYGPALGKLAAQHGITLFASSLEGVNHAAVSYVAEPAVLAEKAFEMAQDILMHKQVPATLPVRKITVERKLIINTALCKDQGLYAFNAADLVNAIQRDPRFSIVQGAVVIR